MRNLKIKRKRKLKNCLKNGILLLVLLLTLTNCEKEDSNLKNEEIGIKAIFEKKEMTVDQFRNKLLNSSFIASKKTSKDYSKFIFNTFYQKKDDDFVIGIDTSKVIVFFNGNLTTYTVAAYTKDNSVGCFYNIVFRESNNKFEEFLFKYTPSNSTNIDGNYDNIFEGNIDYLNADGEVLKSFNTNNSNSKNVNSSELNAKDVAVISCTFTAEPIYDNCGAGGNADGHGPSGDPNCNGSPLIGYNYEISCPEGPATGGGNTNPDPTDPDYGSGGGSTGGDESTNSLPTDPLLSEKLWSNRGNIYLPGILQLTDSADFDWIIANPNIANELYDYILANKYSQESKNFAELAKDTYIDKSDFNLNDFDEFNQFIPDYKARMTQQELLIFNNMSKKFQTRYLYNANKAQNKAMELFPGMQRNTKADAFRHSYFHSLNTYFIGENLSIQLGDAHEIETPDSLILEKVMDLFNNQVGREKAKNPAIYFNAYGTLVVRIFDVVKNGNLKYLTPLNNDGTINSSTQLIPTNQ